MARTSFRATVTETTPYTVPAGKTAIFKAMFLGANALITIGGAQVARFGNNPVWAFELGPFTANAGDVISTPSVGIDTDQYGIVGFLYDN